MGDISSAGRYEPHIQNTASLPSIPFVDRVAFTVQLVGTVEMRSAFDGSLAVVVHLSTPIDHLPVSIFALKLEPHVEGINSASRKEVTDGSSADHYVHSGGHAGLQFHTGGVNRRRELSDFANDCRSSLLGFLSDSKTGHRLHAVSGAPYHRSITGLRFHGAGG